jgi:uncharacterized protein
MTQLESPKNAHAGYPQTERSTPTRYKERASYDRAAVHAVLDEALVCHVGFIRDGAPVVLPTLHARIDDTLYIHGSTGGRFALLDGEPLSLTVTLIDGLVLARSWFHHSVGYRSVVVHGTARLVADEQERWDAMESLIEHVATGRTADSRPPSRKELAAVAIVAIDLSEVSLKSRGSNVVDEPEDLDSPYWAGTIPLRLTPAAPVPTEDLTPGIALPEYLADYARD